MYSWLQDSVWDSVMENYEGYSESEIRHSVYKGIPFWKKIIFSLFFGRVIVEEIVHEAVAERTADVRNMTR